MERFYRFAGITFRVSGSETDMYLEDGVLEPFRVTGTDCDHSLELKIVSALPGEAGMRVFEDGRKRVCQDGDIQDIWVGQVAESVAGAYMRIRRQGTLSSVQVLRQAVPDRIMPRLVLNAMEAEHHIVKHGGFLLHASFIRWKKQAILFTAPSGTGKSTQAELWRTLRGAEVINGDRAAVTLERDAAFAWGIPFSGTSGIGKNGKMPIAAIVSLSQGPESVATRLTGLRAFRCVWEGCSVNVWSREDVLRCTETVTEVVNRVPVYHLACTPDETAVMALERILEEGK